MRAALERTAQALWAGDRPLLAVTMLPAELAVRIGVALRGAAYDRGWLPARRALVPVISVGNLAVGGAGKTPLARWAARLLADSGHRPAVVLRGYGRDETLLHRRWNPDVPVVVDPDRVRGARRAAEGGSDVVVLDDGFQHRRLGRDLDLVAVATERSFPSALLPRGPYREPASALRRADVVVVTHRSAPAAAVDAVEGAVRRAAPGALVARARLHALGWEDLEGAPASAPEGEILAVAGIAGPRSFVDLVAARTGARTALLAFPDHHEFSSVDLERIRRMAGGRTVVVTEKDAVKLRERSGELSGVRVLTLGIAIEPDRAAALRDRILAAVERRKA